MANRQEQLELSDWEIDELVAMQEGQDLRVKALDRAMRHHANQVDLTGTKSPEDIVNVAEVFERYLSGGQAKD